jgi:hypothetical protein
MLRTEGNQADSLLAWVKDDFIVVMHAEDDVPIV